MPEEGTDRDRALPRERGSRIPRAVWLIVALHILLMACYSVLVPTYRGPDEPLHVDLVLAVQHDFRYPALGDRYVSEAIRRSRDLVAFEDFESPHLARAQAVPRSQRPPFTALGLDVPTQQANQLPQHPPLYYVLAAGVSRAIVSATGGLGAWPFDRYVGLLRLVDVFLMAPLPLLAFATSRRLGYPEDTGIAASIFIVAIPELSYLGATVNNDTLLIPLFGVLTLLLARVMTGDDSIRTASLTGVVAGLALLTKGFALATPLWVLAAYAVAWRQRPTRRRSFALDGGVASGIAVVVGGWWWVRNVALYGAVQPALPLPPPTTGPGTDPSWWVRQFLGSMTQRFWSAIATHGGRIPIVVLLLATGITLVGVLAAFTKRHETERARLALLLVPLFAIALIVAAGSFQAYRRSGYPSGLQGRYLFPGIAGLAVVVMVGLAGLMRHRGRDLPSSVFVGAAVIQGFAIWRITHAFWGPEGSSLLEHVRAMLVWSPWPPAIVIGLGVLTLFVAITTWIEIRGVGRRADGSAPEHR